MRRLAMVAMLAIGGSLIMASASSAVDRASWSPSSYDFGSVRVGQSSPVHTFTLTSHVADYQPAPAVFAFNFEVVGSDCPATLGTGASCTAQVVFKPRGPGPYDEDLEGNRDSGSGIAAESELTGYGVATATKCKKKGHHSAAAEAKKKCKKKK
jgi:hypothetical protein